MKSALVGLLAFITASSFTGLVRGQISIDTTLHVEYFASISGRNSNGQLIEGIVSFDSDDNLNETRKLETDFVGNTDLGSADVQVSVSATHTDTKKLLSASMKGVAAISRPALNAGGFFGETGSMRASANALAMYHDVLTFTTLQSLISDPMHVEGFVRLKGSLDALSVKGGPEIGGEGSASVALSGTGMPRDATQHFQVAGGIGSFPEVNPINMFSYDVTPGAPFRIDFKMELNGRALVSGAQFTVRDPAHATSQFSANFQNTLEWGGITSVTNARTGEPITDWTVTSASGFDYTRFFPEVPEPASFVLLASALCASFAGRRTPAFAR